MLQMAFSKLSKSILKLSVDSQINSVRPLFGTCKNKDATTGKIISKEKKYTPKNYEPLPVVISKGEGTHVVDPEGKSYLDFLAGYATLNLGHCHPKIVKVAKEQVGILTHTSRAFHNNWFPEFCEYATGYFGYEKVLPMNTGVEACETAVKIARRWGYMEKKICAGRAMIVFPEGNFWGRTTSAISTSTNPTYYENFGPFMPGFGLIPYDDLCALEEVLKNPNVCAYFMEPIQGEAGVIVPSKDYLQEVRKLCSDNNVLWICDEIQTGLGRTGALLGCDHECVRPDILLIGKGLAGGVMPMSAVLANNNVMKVLTPGSHGSTFGGNPLACRLAITTLQVIEEDKLAENALKMGEKFRKMLKCRLPKEVVCNIRGKGLMTGITICPEYGTAYEFCLKLKDEGLLTKNCNTHDVRFTPPLIVTEAEVNQAINIIDHVVQKIRGCI